MGLIDGTVQLSNPSGPELQGLEERALADGHRRTGHGSRAAAGSKPSALSPNVLALPWI